MLIIQSSNKPECFLGTKAWFNVTFIIIFIEKKTPRIHSARNYGYFITLCNCNIIMEGIITKNESKNVAAGDIFTHI